MNKKKFATFMIVLIILIAIICVFVFKPKEEEVNPNGENSNTEQSFKKHSSEDWKSAAIKYYESQNGTAPSNVKLYTDDKDLMIIEFLDSDEIDAQFIERYVLDYRTGVGTDYKGNPVTLNLD